MKIALAYSSKDGLLEEYKKRFAPSRQNMNIPDDMLAEGDSDSTIQYVTDTLTSFGHRIFGIEANDNAADALQSVSPDLVFNIAEGLFGDFRESYIPMLCERLNIPYTGSDPLTLGLCLNKARTKEILSYHKIPNAPFQIVYPGKQFELKFMQFPAILKPVSEGSSKGIYNDSVVYNRYNAIRKIKILHNQYNQPVIIEKYLEGEEFTVASWGNAPLVDILPIVAIEYNNLPENANPIYSYEAKWIWDTPEEPLQIFQCPAKLSFVQKVQMHKIIKKIWRVFNIHDWCRIDIRMDREGIPFVLEINPLPGILPNPEDNSCFPKAARTAGYDYQAMIGKIVSIACARLGISDGTHRQKTKAAHNL